MKKIIKIPLIILLCLLFVKIISISFDCFFIVNYEKNQKIEKFEDSERKFILFEIKSILRNDFPIVFYKYFKGSNDINLFKSKYAEDHLDALRHTYMAARLSSLYSANFVHLLGEINELRYGAANEANDMNMDLWNNEMGIKIGLENKGATKEVLMKKVFDCIDVEKKCIVDKNIATNPIAKKSDLFNFIFYNIFKKYNIVFKF